MNRSKDRFNVRNLVGGMCVFVEEREEEREERFQVEERGGSLQGTKEWSEGGNGKEMTKDS